jgi:uncharacterized protein (TIGR02231 family)
VTTTTTTSGSAPSPTLTTHTVAAPPRRVTLLEDRAQVRRAATLGLSPGQHRVVIEGVSPVTADRSLVARAKGARVLEARVVRRWRLGVEEQKPDERKLLEEREALAAQARLVEARRGQADLRRQFTERAVQLLVASINAELPWAKDGFQARWGTDLEGLFRAVRELEDTAYTAARERQRLGERQAVVGAHLSERGDPGERTLATSIEVDLLVEREGSVALEVEAMVPCALWRPIHRATLRGSTARFECEAAVWQATGEDWVDVELLVSTARPTQRAEPASLRDDLLRTQRRADKTVQVAVREETIQTTGEGQAVARKDLPGVDDGGETRTLGAPQKATIPSTGRLSRIPIFELEAPAEVDRIARPERSPLVHLRSKQANTSKHPILAGPVELLRESGYVGRGEVGFVAPGERFVMGWGADDSVRVRREQTQEREVTRITGKQTVTTTVTLSLSNLDSIPVSFTLEERVLVSEVEQVTVEVDPKLTSPAATADKQGIVAWAITLPPRGTKTVKLVHRVIGTSAVHGI